MVIGFDVKYQFASRCFWIFISMKYLYKRGQFGAKNWGQFHANSGGQFEMINWGQYWRIFHRFSEKIQATFPKNVYFFGKD
jgi:hypothetical protein